MDNNRKTVLAMVITVVILIAVFAGFWLTLFRKEPPRVSLPTAEPDSTEEPAGSGADDGSVLVEVTPQTVQSVVGTLSRPDSYSRDITIETYWGEDGAAVSTAQVWVDGGYTRISALLPNGTVENTMIGDGKRYRWYNNESTCYVADAEAADADLMQRIPTYEDVLDLDMDSITDAGYEARGGLGCIYVETLQEELGYRERYWISVELGLLVGAETVKEDRVVLRMSAYTVTVPIREGLGFALPDGTVLHTPVSG